MRHAVELLEKRLLEPLEREQKRKLRALNERECHRALISHETPGGSDMPLMWAFRIHA